MYAYTLFGCISHNESSVGGHEYFENFKKCTVHAIPLEDTKLTKETTKHYRFRNHSLVALVNQ